MAATTRTIYGSSRDDRMRGSDYDTVYYFHGLEGNDTFSGLGGYTTAHMYGGPGNDTYNVGLMDKVYEKPGEGIDTVTSSYSYSLHGQVVENLWLVDVNPATATGNSLNNTITGNVGANTLYGMGGNDTLNGAGGNDTLIGGDGRDVFAVGSLGNVDTIVDFEHGVDRIDLPRDGYFRFIGTERFHKVAGELHVYHLADGNTYVSGDIYGDGKADFTMKVLGRHDFTSADFIL